MQVRACKCKFDLFYLFFSFTVHLIPELRELTLFARVSTADVSNSVLCWMEHGLLK